jgi:hypothetical protein
MFLEVLNVLWFFGGFGWPFLGTIPVGLHISVFGLLLGWPCARNMYICDVCEMFLCGLVMCFSSCQNYEIANMLAAQSF